MGRRVRVLSAAALTITALLLGTACSGDGGGGGGSAGNDNAPSGGPVATVGALIGGESPSSSTTAP